MNAKAVWKGTILWPGMDEDAEDEEEDREEEEGDGHFRVPH
jgi:hypothetical protein